MLSPLAADAALRWTERLLAAAILIGTAELIAVRRTCADDGIWRWPTLARELPWYGGVLAYRPFLAVLGVQLAAAALLMAGAGAVAAPVLWCTTLLVGLRFRGTFNGGSDSMQMVLLSALVLAHAGERPVLVRAALLYVAVQCTLSYGVAGIAKLREPAWRDGRALREFLQSPQYGTPRGLVRIAEHPRATGILSAGVLAFECGFPAAWLGPRACACMIGAALCFHVANVGVFGLNRFLLTWAAAYPALYYAASSRP